MRTNLRAVHNLDKTASAERLMPSSIQDYSSKIKYKQLQGGGALARCGPHSHAPPLGLAKSLFTGHEPKLLDTTPSYCCEKTMSGVDAYNLTNQVGEQGLRTQLGRVPPLVEAVQGNQPPHRGLLKARLPPEALSRSAPILPLLADDLCSVRQRNGS